MITFQAIASSSAGNAYIADNGTSKLLLEAGVRIQDLRKATGFRLSEIDACLLTHSHKDHCAYVADIMKSGIDVYASEGTIDELGLTGHRVHAVEPGKTFTIGTFDIMPFDVQHDTAQPVGFLIATPEREKLLFLTDTWYCRYKFQGVSVFAVECNYSLDILDANIAAGSVPAALRGRLLRSHFSLEHAKEFLLANDLSKVVEVHLLHLSSGNSDEARFKREIQEITGCPVFVAGK